MLYKKEVGKKLPSKGGQPTKYNEDIARRITLELTHSTIDVACDAVGISEQTYYNWLYEYPEFFELSKKSRLTKAVHHFNEAQKVLKESRDARAAGDKDFRSDLARLEADFHLRLAGKSNQGLFGDKIDLKNEGTVMPPIQVILNKDNSEA